MKHILMSGLVAALLVFSGCSDREDAVSPVSPSTGDAIAVMTVSEPVGGVFLGRVDGTAQTIGWCDPYVLKIQVNGTGALSFLGQSTFSGSLCSQWTDVSPPFEGNMTGTGTAVAANGDELYMTMTGSYYAGTPPPTTLTMTGTYTITGGTGRFSEATGSGELYGEQDLQDFSGVHASWFGFDGTFLPR